MNDTTSTTNDNTWSISRIADCFGVSRKTVTRKILKAGLAPTTKRLGYPVYSFKDAAIALMTADDDRKGLTPGEMDPGERKDWFDSELKRIKLVQEISRLIPADEARSHMSEVCEKITTALEMMAEVIEKEVDMNPEQLTVIVSAIESIATKVISVHDVKPGWEEVKKKCIDVARTLKVESELIQLLPDKLNQHYSTARFVKFIIDYAPIIELQDCSAVRHGYKSIDIKAVGKW